MAFKRWLTTQVNETVAAQIAHEVGISVFAARILVARGYDSPAAVTAFLEGTEDFNDPFELIDMEPAVDRIQQALEDGEKIAVYGDYDCDGITATAIVFDYLKQYGADVVYYIPERSEGYGLNCQAIGQLADQGVTLIITVDNGISALEECEFAMDLGIDVVVTDHHQVGAQLPEAIAVVNPHRIDCPSQFKQLCGAGVALKLVAALEGAYAPVVAKYGALAAIGTIADVMPLLQENRLLVRRGLVCLQQTEHIGLSALIEAAGIDTAQLGAQTVAFGLAPRINAAGRLGNAQLALELLLCKDSGLAIVKARQLCLLNQQRQALEAEIVEAIKAHIAQHPHKLDQRVLVLWGEDWDHGVIGIVSAKVLEMYGKPNILLSVHNGVAVGSARSFGEFSLYEALCSCQDFLVRYGGHRQAAGMTVMQTDLEAFEQAINAYAKVNFKDMPLPEYLVDDTVALEELTVANVKTLELLEPCGAGNQPPMFVIGGVQIKQIVPLSQNKHLRLAIQSGQTVATALYFKMSIEEFPFCVGDTVDLLASVDINEFRGVESVSVKIKDMRPAGFLEKQVISAKVIYERIRRRETFDEKFFDKITPSREEFATVYRQLRRIGRYTNHMDTLFFRFLPLKINYCKFNLILDILAQMGLVELPPDRSSISVIPDAKKVDLEQSPILQRLRAKQV